MVTRSKVELKQSQPRQVFKNETQLSTNYGDITSSELFFPTSTSVEGLVSDLHLPV